MSIGVHLKRLSVDIPEKKRTKPHSKHMTKNDDSTHSTQPKKRRKRKKKDQNNVNTAKQNEQTNTQDAGTEVRDKPTRGPGRG